MTTNNRDGYDAVVVPENDKEVKSGTTNSSSAESLIYFFSLLLVIVTFPLSVFLIFRYVNEYERIIIFRMGRLRHGGVSGPGVYIVLPCVDTCQIVSLRTVTLNVPPQEILTKDSVTVTVDAVLYYRIIEPLKVVMQVDDYAKSTELLAATTLRNALGIKTLTEILAEREVVAHNMQTVLDNATHEWGIVVERVEIKDVSLPKELQRSMAAEAEAARDARAKVISAEGEKQSSKALQEASEIISKSPAALQLRYLQTLHSIAAEKNSTIIFPLPMELMRGFTAIDMPAPVTGPSQ